ncbi:hypothetical protein Daus18300_009890 [Diaporthe australafricana]|uniref:Uncharacterized protein n=1 Tax=Diaporthe australafricana TaxID=127596 RepID=A0ABR3WCN1_9PEZI
MREWRLINAAAAAQVTGQAAAMAPASTSTPPPAAATNGPPPSAADDTPEVATMFTIEEIEAHARLLAQFQRPQSQHRQRIQEELKEQ